MSGQMTAKDTEIEHARRAAEGSAEALRAIYTRHADAMHRVARGLTGSADVADDIIQDVFIGLPEALRRYTGTGSLGRWLNVVTTRVALQYLRGSRRRREESIDAARGVASHDREQFLGPAIQRLIDDLPDRLRLVLVLSDVEGYTHPEIAEVLGISVSASQVRLHRARRLLRDRLRGTR